MEFEPLGGGITNHNFKVAVGGEVFVLRIGGKDTELLGIDREHEHEAALAAARLGVGPEVVAFVDGLPRHPLRRRARSAAPTPATVGSAPAPSHGAPADHEPLRLVPRRRGLRGHGRRPRGHRPIRLRRAHELAQAIEARRAAAPLVTCHNDLLAANFIDDGSRLWIVDWEYAGMGDPFFDLANFAVNNELDEDGESALLEAYGSATDRRGPAR